MGACNSGKLILFVQNVLWDLGVPQSAASILYEDNDACIAMANTQKPTSCTRHMDIKYHILCEWVERGLLVLARVDTSVNMSNHFPKQLGPTLFQCHVDYIMGRIPPHHTQWFCKLFGSTSQALPTTSKPVSPQPITAVAAHLFSFWSPVLASAF
jgi:hypothetical protein